MKTIPITKMITAYEFEELTPYLTYVQMADTSVRL